MASFPSKDLLLRAFDTLPAHQLLTANQVAIVLQMSPRWLEEQRGKGNPPPWVKIQPGRAVRYAVGPLRIWIQGLISTTPTSTHAASSAHVKYIKSIHCPPFCIEVNRHMKMRIAPLAKPQKWLIKYSLDRNITITSVDNPDGCELISKSYQKLCLLAEGLTIPVTERGV